MAPSLPLFGGAVERDHGRVDQALIGGVHAFQLRRNHGLHIGDGLQHALAQVVALVAVAQFHGFVLAGGGARGHDGAAQCAAFQNHVRFHGGIAARIQNLARANCNNLGHISPRNAVLQPVIQFGTAIHGKSFSGGALNRCQKLRHFLNLPFQRFLVVESRGTYGQAGLSQRKATLHLQREWLLELRNRV